MTFRVETTPAAERDADVILEWLLSEGAGETGWRWFAALQDAIASLVEFPAPLSSGSGELSLPF